MSNKNLKSVIEDLIKKGHSDYYYVVCNNYEEHKVVYNGQINHTKHLPELIQEKEYFEIVKSCDITKVLYPVKVDDAGFLVIDIIYILPQIKFSCLLAQGFFNGFDQTSDRSEILKRFEVA